MRRYSTKETNQKIHETPTVNYDPNESRTDIQSEGNSDSSVVLPETENQTGGHNAREKVRTEEESSNTQIHNHEQNGQTMTNRIHREANSMRQSSIA